MRHGGRGDRLTSVFRADVERDVLQIALVDFGGQDWAESRLAAVRHKGGSKLENAAIRAENSEKFWLSYGSVIVRERPTSGLNM